jgi:hypothetical protein
MVLQNFKLLQHERLPCHVAKHTTLTFAISLSSSQIAWVFSNPHIQHF